ncbi:glycogen biosynthesis protein GlgD [Ectobacillus polymachus]
MVKRSKQNNPEQKTNNGTNPEYSNAADPIVESKQRNKGTGQPQKAKQ